MSAARFTAKKRAGDGAAACAAQCIGARIADRRLHPACGQRCRRPRLSAYFATIKPGDTVYKSHIEALISDTPGVRDRVLVSPSANQNATITPHIQWLALGTFEMTLL